MVGLMNVEIVRGSAADIPRLEPLWVAVHHVHQESMPELGPYVDDTTTWAYHRDLYAELLAHQDSILLLVLVDGELAGYGLACVHDVETTWIPDTWVTGPRIGEVESLSIAEGFRGTGIGSRLLDELEAFLREVGAEDIIIGALPGNPAVRLYERRGYTPTWLYLSKFAGR
jgi:ribosomal protein S18 acetylase RimI-like enzyme